MMIMPELPDIIVYIEHLRTRLIGQVLQGVRLASPFLLRSVDPPIDAIIGKELVTIRRLGKRIAIGLEDDFFIVLHLMIAGRLHWKDPGSALPRKYALAAFDFANGTLLVTEAGSKRRATLHIVQGEEALRAHSAGGLEVMDGQLSTFRVVLTRENHTLKRALTDPHLISGIGNAYSDEILHRARLSPMALTHRLKEEEISALFNAIRTVLAEWTDRLREQTGANFPEKVTAFRPEMAVHGRFGKPCPVCGTAVQRIRYAENETNYCPRCQTQGKILSDRSLARLLNKDWPKSIEELEERSIRQD
jgi:formamidopyrimidine-DNA glycosylase